MNNEQRERDGMDSLLKDLGQAAFDANIDEYERIESEIKKAFATLPAPSDWEDEWYGEDGFVYPEMQAFFEANAEGNGYSLNVTDIPEMLDMAVRRALASRPGVDVECDHVFVGDHTEEGGVMCCKCGVDIHDTPPAPSDWEDELYRLAEKINLSEAFAADDQIEEVIAFVRALTTSTEGEDD